MRKRLDTSSSKNKQDLTSKIMTDRFFIYDLMIRRRTV